MAADMKKLSISNLSCHRSGNEVFKNLSFNLDSGEICLLTGSNGSGKTTLLRALAGLVPISFGSITFNKTQTLNDNFYILGHKLGIKEEITPYEDLLFWSSVYEYENFQDIIYKLGLSDSKFLKCKYLSQGQKQRLAIARLIVSKKSIWLLDEPISSLDKDGINLLKEIINDHLSTGGIAVISSHIDFLKKYDLKINMDK